MATEAPGPTEVTRDRGKRDPFTVFLVVACIALSVLVFLLARENRRLKADLSQAAAGQMPADSLKPGDAVEPLALVADGGKPSRLDFSAEGPRTLLLVFSTHCPACEKTLPIWNDLLASGLPRDLRAVGVRTDREKAGAATGTVLTAGLHFPVFAPQDPSPPLLGKIPYIPAAVLLDSRGLVVKVWVGIPGDAQIKELRELVSS